MPERRFQWHTFSIDQGEREVVSLYDEHPPRRAGQYALDGSITNWLPATPATIAAVRGLCSWLNKHCPADMTADEFWASLHSDEG